MSDFASSAAVSPAGCPGTGGHPGLRRRQLLAAALLSGAAQAQTPPPSEASAGPLPALGSVLRLPDLPMLDGSVLRPADTEGQVLVLYWWASWCPFCAVQSPLMEKLWLAHRQRGLRLVGLSIDKRPEEAVAHLARKGYTFASSWVSPELARQLPKPKGLPITVVVGRQGRVVMSEAGQLFPEDIEGIARFL